MLQLNVEEPSRAMALQLLLLLLYPLLEVSLLETPRFYHQ